jgi:hypothetical protein
MSMINQGKQLRLSGVFCGGGFVQSKSSKRGGR